nr:hypothetical protein [Klebsiella pneumoniae subsp. pneumoniae]
MQNIDETRTVTQMEKLIVTGASPFWIADFMRDLIWEHGLAQNAVPSLQTLFSVAILRNGCVTDLLNA